MNDDSLVPAEQPARLLAKRLDNLLKQQHGMVARRQLTDLHIGWDAVEANIAARRWVARTPRVISTFTGEPTVDQRRWLAVLHAGPRSMLGGLTCGSRHGLTGWERDDVTVMVDDELSFEPVDGVRFFRSRRPFHLLQSPKPGIPSARLEHGVLLWAAYEATPRAAVGVLAALVQQRLTTAPRIIEAVDELRPLRRAKMLKRALSEIAGGAQSGAELDVARMCCRYGIRLPARQTVRTDRSGRRRWTDCEWDLPGGVVLVLEVDGGVHLGMDAMTEDARRGRRLVRVDRMIIRCTSHELRHEDEEVARDLIALGLAGRLPGDAA